MSNFNTVYNNTDRILVPLPINPLSPKLTSSICILTYVLYFKWLHRNHKYIVNTTAELLWGIPMVTCKTNRFHFFKGNANYLEMRWCNILIWQLLTIITNIQSAIYVFQSFKYYLIYQNYISWSEKPCSWLWVTIYSDLFLFFFFLAFNFKCCCIIFNANTHVWMHMHIECI